MFDPTRRSPASAGAARAQGLFERFRRMPKATIAKVEDRVRVVLRA